MAGALLVGLSACSDKHDDAPSRSLTLSDGSIKITVENPDKWSAYASELATGIEHRAAGLLEAWETKLAAEFKAREAEESVQKIIDGCALTAQTVSSGRVDDPLKLLIGGYGMQAAAGIDIWFGLHSADDYVNNIISIRNVYYGSITGAVSPGSLAEAVAELNPQADANVRRLLQDAQQAIKQSTGGAQLSAQARAIASELAASIAGLKPILAAAPASVNEAIVATYVDEVVLPTYRLLAAETADLAQLAQAMAANPNDATFAAFTQSWARARASLSLTAAYTL